MIIFSNCSTKLEIYKFRNTVLDFISVLDWTKNRASQTACLRSQNGVASWILRFCLERCLRSQNGVASSTIHFFWDRPSELYSIPFVADLNLAAPSLPTLSQTVFVADIPAIAIIRITHSQKSISEGLDAAGAGKMVVISAARDYVNRMLQDISGMKVLILDSSTVCSFTTLSFEF